MDLLAQLTLIVPSIVLQGQLEPVDCTLRHPLPVDIEGGL